ncbi:MAG: type IV secretion system protein VirB10 [Dehalococcoidia bacterium]
MSLLDRFRRPGADPPPSPEAVGGEGTVEGERGVSAVQRPPSLQSRLSNVLAFALIAAIGLGLLGWYYGKVVTSRAAGRTAAESSARNKAEGEINLRPLGRVDPPPLMQTVLGDSPDEPPEDIPAALLRPDDDPPVARSRGYTPPAEKPRDTLIERQLSGRAFVTTAGPAGGTANADATGSWGNQEKQGGGDLDALLRPSVTPAVQAQVLPTRRMLLPKGAFLDCTLETALDSTLPGMTTCILATDAFSADGSVVLLERGTKLVGETRGQVRQGSARVYVLWTEARTSKGVVVPLASPGTDELGRAGLPGRVDRHFMERFGAAILVSVIDGVIQAEVASRRGNGSTVVVDPSGSKDIMTEILRSTINIPPTVVKPQGDRIQVLVARDLDFRSVYELRPASR